MWRIEFTLKMLRGDRSLDIVGRNRTMRATNEEEASMPTIEIESEKRIDKKLIGFHLRETLF